MQCMTTGRMPLQTWRPGHLHGGRCCISVRAQAAPPTTAGSIPHKQQKRVVITGGSKGLGYAMAREFLALGDSIALCSRTPERLEVAVAALRADFGADRVHGMPADCSKPKDVKNFSELVLSTLGGVDIWINGAGELTTKRLLADVEPDEILRVVGTNVAGSLLCSQAAIQIMRGQPASEQPRYMLFNMGFSKWGAKLTKSAVTHKATKMALTQMTDSLQDELKEAGITSIGVHNLSPGLVLTDLLLKDSTPAARRFFNALAEEPETIAAALVPLIRSAHGTGTSVDYLNPADAALKVLRGLPQIVNGGRFFDKNGDRVPRPGELYQENGVRVQVPDGQRQRQQQAAAQR